MVRTVLFWMHLAAGVVAGIIILLMSATGVALTYERQINEWSTTHLQSIPPSPGAARLPLEQLLATVAQSHPGTTVTGATLSARADAPVTVTTEASPIYVDAYTGRDLGERRGAAVRETLASLRAWHRWLAAEGDQRATARSITGWSNLLFLFIVASGIYLWLPKVLNWVQIRQVLFFRSTYGTAKARDFNWHNVIGIWSAIPLFVIVLGAVPISFPWASDLVYRVVGDEPPPRRAEGAGPRPSAGRASGQRAEGRRAAQVSLSGLDAGVARAMADQPGWRTVSVRLPRRPDEPLPFTVDRGDGGQPQLRSSLTISRTGDVTARETFRDQTPGRRLRSILRFAHTGEVLGLTGQTVAGLASAGAVVMVWTGLALTLRRFRAWQVRRPVLNAGTPSDMAASTGRS